MLNTVEIGYDYSPNKPVLRNASSCREVYPNYTIRARTRQM